MVPLILSIAKIITEHQSQYAQKGEAKSIATLDRSAGDIAMTLIAVMHPPIMRKYIRGVEVCCWSGIFR